MEEMGASMRIGELARRAGIPPATLRAWERRYGIVEPLRTEAGYRLYSADQEERVRQMVDLVSHGIAPAQAAEQLQRFGSLAAQPDRMGQPDAARAELVRVLLAMDETGANATIDRAISTYSTTTLLSGVLMPAMREIGEAWVEGEASVAQEHFASNLVRGRLAGLGRGWGAGSGPLALLACPSGEQHELGLLGFGVALRERGWRIAYIGPDTPAANIDEAASRLGAVVIVVALTAPEAPEAAHGAIAALSAAPVVLAGSAATEEIAERSGARYGSGDVVEVASAIDRDYRR